MNMCREQVIPPGSKCQVNGVQRYRYRTVNCYELSLDINIAVNSCRYPDPREVDFVLKWIHMSKAVVLISVFKDKERGCQ